MKFALVGIFCFLSFTVRPDFSAHYRHKHNHSNSLVLFGASLFFIAHERLESGLSMSIGALATLIHEETELE